MGDLARGVDHVIDDGGEVGGIVVPLKPRAHRPAAVNGRDRQAKQVHIAERMEARAGVILRAHGISVESTITSTDLVVITQRILGAEGADLLAAVRRTAGRAMRASRSGARSRKAPEMTPALGADGRLSPALIELIAVELETSLDELIELIFERMREEIPDYARPDAPAWKTDVETSVRALSVLYIRMVREARRLSMAELAVLRTIGTHRAEQGVSLDALSTALRVAMRVGWEHTVARLTRLESSPEMFQALGQMGLQLLTFIDDVSLAVTDSFLRLQEKAMTATDRTRRAFLQDLLRGDLGSPADAQTRALAEGFPLRQRYRVLLVACPQQIGSGSRVREAASMLTASLAGTFELESLGEQTSHMVVLIPDECNDLATIITAAREALSPPGAIAVGTHAPASPPELPALYRRLRDLLPTALAVYAPGSLVDEDDVGLFSLLSAGPAKERDRFIESVMGGVLRLPAQQRRMLLETLVVLHQNSDGLRATGATLHIHPKTVQYRTRKIQKLTGLSWSHAGDRLRLAIALHLLRLDDRTGDIAGSWGSGALLSPSIA